MTHIEDNLYLGSLKDVNVDFLTSHHISVVINVANDCIYPHPNLSLLDYYHLGIEDDDDDLLGLLLQLIPVIQRRITNEAILVHCRAGVSRSASVIVGYLMLSTDGHLSRFSDMLMNGAKCYPIPTLSNN